MSLLLENSELKHQTYTIHETGSVVQSLDSSSFSPHIGAEPGRAKRRVQDNLDAHAQNAAIFSPQIGEKSYLEVLSRFGLQRDFAE